MTSCKFRCTLVAGAVLATGALIFAHHIAVPLSSVFGTEVMTEVTYLAKSDNVGVPAYRVGTDAHTVNVSDGAQFATSDGSGGSETVTFTSGMFADPTKADLEEVVNAINGQLTLAVASIDNNTLVLRGVQGGSSASLTLSDGPGAPLGSLGLVPGTIQGADDIELVLSLPDSEHADNHEHGLAHHPYLVVVSATEGTTKIGGFEVPIAVDPVTSMGLRATQYGFFPGSLGQLDENEDAAASFDTALLPHMFKQGLPDHLYFAFVVFGEEMNSIEYVSNRFDVAIEK